VRDFYVSSFGQFAIASGGTSGRPEEPPSGEWRLFLLLRDEAMCLPSDSSWIYSSSSSPPSPSSFFSAALAFLRLTRPGRPPPNGDVRAKSICFWESRRTTKDGTLTICFPTLYGLVHRNTDTPHKRHTGCDAVESEHGHGVCSLPNQACKRRSGDDVPGNPPL